MNSLWSRLTHREYPMTNEFKRDIGKERLCQAPWTKPKRVRPRRGRIAHAVAGAHVQRVRPLGKRRCRLPGDSRRHGPGTARTIEAVLEIRRGRWRGPRPRRCCIVRRARRPRHDWCSRSGLVVVDRVFDHRFGAAVVLGIDLHGQVPCERRRREGERERPVGFRGEEGAHRQSRGSGSPCSEPELKLRFVVSTVPSTVIDGFTTEEYSVGLWPAASAQGRWSVRCH